MEKFKKYAVLVVFFAVLFGIGLGHLLVSDAQYSDSERRALEQLPEFSADGVKDGTYQSALETYLQDQFPLRDTFRGVKTLLNVHLWQMRDTNGYYFADGHWSQLSGETDLSQVNYAVGRFESVLERHPEIGSAYYAVVPDKNYFLAEPNGYNTLDYDAILESMEALNAQKIDLFLILSLNDYYQTDSHWRQERLQSVVETLCEAMGVTAAPFESYVQKTLEGFRGVYGDHTADLLHTETLTYLVNEAIENATVSRVNEMTGQWEEIPMYDEAEFDNPDPYDIFLSGAEALIRIENPKASSDKHLILFRDSFGSSLAPLLTESYATITVVDLRYISANYVDRLVDFENADVLFLYSTTMLNTAGGVLK